MKKKTGRRPSLSEAIKRKIYGLICASLQHLGNSVNLRRKDYICSLFMVWEPLNIWPGI